MRAKALLYAIGLAFFLREEYPAGDFKLCVYSDNGNEVAIRVDFMTACPASVDT